MSVAYLANSKKDYKDLKIKNGKTEIWEDGMRTTGEAGTYEWWYTDAEFEDGTKVVAVFFTKNGFDVKKGACPTAILDITLPDGREIAEKISEGYGKKIRAKKDKCDVHVKDSYLTYVDGDYHLNFSTKDVTYNVVMKSLLPMWRPNTGHWYFGDKKFCWFVAQPSASVEGYMIINNKKTLLKGTGYHDHNWGDIAMNKVMNHWYWGRAKVGAYDIIACDIISEKKYGNTRLPVMMIGKDGIIIEDDQTKTAVIRSGTHQHIGTSKFMDDSIKYMQPSKDENYTIEYVREKDILVKSLLDGPPTGGGKERSTILKGAAKLLGINPTYTRVIGKVYLTIEKNGNSEVIESEGLWEQMFFGANKNATINE